MSSTQHQLIEQCATRLRGIVEALDNIHDTSPQRWSTDLDDVHSSAESLLAMIKDQAPPSEDQLIAAGLSYPLAKEDAVKLWYSGFRSEVITVLEAWEAIGHDTGINPDKEELLESLRNMAAICNAHGNDMPAQSVIDQRQVIADAITGALAFGAQASQPPTADHWLRPFYDIGRAEGQRTQDLAMLVRMLASSLKRHAPESNLVARAANYLMAKGLTGSPLRNPLVQAEDAPVIGCLCGMPMTEGHHSPDGCCNLEEFAPQAQADQAEAERQEMSSERAAYFMRRFKAEEKMLGPNEQAAVDYVLSLIAQHERIVGELRADRDSWAKRWVEAVRYGARIEEQRDAALTNVDALAVQVLKLGGTISFDHHRTDQAGQVPQAWLDVQAERKRQVEVEGWTPEHDDAHSHGQMARAAACYALAGSSAPNDGTAALLVSLAWPWDEQWWKPSTARRDMVKACALGLAEIERLDRVAASQGGPSDA
ncbi:hypothetical protein [Pseudomonas paraeruginosa]|uniref:hypothetical protein n=1 Tax=Pseudomonas paraeruginosa TaxID=2994495 RepID=UPI0039FCD464